MPFSLYNTYYIKLLCRIAPRAEQCGPDADQICPFQNSVCKIGAHAHGKVLHAHVAALRGLRLTVAETLHIDQSTKGKRLMLPNARVLIHQPAIDQGFGKATEIEIQAKEMLRMREWLENTLAKHTGRDIEKIRKDIEVDTFLTAQEAKEYGIVDEVLEHRS